MAQSVDSTVMGLLKAYRKMLDYIQQDMSGRPEKDSIIKTAKAALKHAEIEIGWSTKRAAAQVSEYFGRMGFHYDFQLIVKDVKKRKHGYHLECVDVHGREYIVRAQDEEVQFVIQPGLHLYFRGKITGQRIVKRKPNTFVEVVSCLQNVNPLDSI
ncbi:MAG: hypothetical protein PHD01_02690 [Geobacteraceae bacterium]|nr:hypothetical protein [Geobacteraceae bacterium]